MCANPFGTKTTVSVDSHLLSEAIEQASMAVLITCPEGTIRYVNETFLWESGYSRDELVGQNPRLLKSEEHEAEFFEHMWATITEGEVWHGQIVNMTKSGSPYRKDMTIYSVKDGAGAITHFVSISRDVSRDLELEAQLRQSQKMEAIGQLASGIAHEINTPTQYIGDNIQFFRDSFGDIQLLLEKYAELGELVANGEDPSELAAWIRAKIESVDLEFLLAETPGAIERTLEGNNRVAEVVRAMKEFAHPSAEECTPTDINRAINNTISVSRNEWKYVAEMVTDLDPELPMVPCIPGAFNQVVLNIIVNASHAIADVVGEGVSERGTITVSTRSDGEWAEIRIQDTGTGIPEHLRHKIYNPFFTTKEAGRGTGQGMAIVRSVVVDRHGGTLDFETEVGKGTTFIVRLPLVAADTDRD